METPSPSVENVPEATMTFFNFVVQQPKDDLANLIQYAIMMLIPAVIVVYGTTEFMDPLAPDATIVQLGLEIVASIVAATAVIYFANRMIIYVPTWSGVPYNDVNLLGAIIPTIVVLVGMGWYNGNQHSRTLGARISELVDRALNQANPPKKQATQPKTPEEKYPAAGPPPAQATSVNKSGDDHQTNVQQPVPDFNAMYQGAAGSNIEPFSFNSGGSYSSL